MSKQIYIKDICAIGDLTKPLKISPIGKVNGIDGRTFNIDGQAVLDDLEKNGLKIVLNVDHGWTDKHGSEAAGWFADFTLAQDGIYAVLALNELGKKLLEKQAYKYLSPEYLSDEFRNVVSIIGVGLVNQPNLLNQALNSTQPNSGDETGEDNMNKNQEQKDELQRLKDENTTLKTKVDTFAQQLREQKVNNAISESKLLPAKKDFALTLDDNALDAFLKVEAVAAPTTLDKDNNSLNPDSLDDDAGNDIFKQLDI